MRSHPPDGLAGNAALGAPTWALEATTDCVVLLDRDFRIAYVNRAAAELNGFEPRDVVGRANGEVWPAMVGTDADRQYREAMATGEPRRFEQHYVGHEGLDLWLEVHAFPSPAGLAIFFKDVTEERRLARMQAEQEARLESAMRATDLGTWRCDLPIDDHPFYWSPQVRRHFGITDDEEINVREFLALLHPDDRQPTADAIARAIAERVPYDVVYRTLGRDGKTRWIRATGNAFYREDGSPYRFDGFTVDLTDRVEAERALARSEERHRALVAASSDVAYCLSSDWSLLQPLDGRGLVPSNSEPARDWLPRNVHAEDLARVRAAIDAAIADKATFELEHRVNRPDGSVGWTLSRAVPILDDRGEIAEWFGAASDITERKRAEASRRESETRYRDLFESMDEGYCVIEVLFAPSDPSQAVDYRFREVNPAFEAQSGMQGVIGRRMLEFVPSIESLWLGNYGRVALTGEPIRFVGEFTGLDRWFEVYAFRVGEPNARHIAVLFTDITSRKRAEASLRSAKEELERRVEERTRELVEKNLELEGFTYSVSHDLRSPLRAIVSKAQITLEDEGPNVSPEGKENLKRLSAAAQRMAELVDDLLQYARLGTRELRLERVDLAAIATAVAADVAAEREGCEFAVRTDYDATADCDPRLIGMALHNLLDNACKYGRPGERPRAEFFCEARGGERVFGVRDNGIGFDMAYVGKLFRPFERLHREEYAGTGIGLANVKRAVERHGGRVWAESEGPGKGATFLFTLSESSEAGES